MKITIWIHKSEAMSGKIPTWYNNCPNDLFWKDYVQVTISQDEFTNLVDDNGLICSIPEGLEYNKPYTIEEIKEALGPELNKHQKVNINIKSKKLNKLVEEKASEAVLKEIQVLRQQLRDNNIMR